ncbi:MAG TPA: hypothetical protein VND93_19505 [Myxococcales bacterium]|nr:hypothetical protein [Myxococcales bacterium]
MTHVVDADVLATIQRAGRCAAVAQLGQLPIIVTDVVWDELTVGALADGASPATVDEMQGLLEKIARMPTKIAPQSPEAETFGKLQAPPPTEDAGEHSVIAVTLHRPGTTAVLLDRRALRRGVEELRGRVLSLHGWLEALLQRGLPRADADAVSSHLCATQKPVRAPLWW